jgi:type IV pilus assembly protein PilY1
VRLLPLRSTAAALALLAATPALAQADAGTADPPPAACFDRALERLDFHMNPPEGGDNNFFTAVSKRSSKTNVSLLYPATASMRHFLKRMYRIRKEGGENPTGCTNRVLDELDYFMPSDITPPAASPTLVGPYRPAPAPTGTNATALGTLMTGVTYPATTAANSRLYPDPGPTYAESGASGQSDNLQNYRAYRYTNWGAGGTTNNTGNNAAPTAETVATACGNVTFDNITSLNPTRVSNHRKNCQQCVVSKGYWINPDPPAGIKDESTNSGVFLGNWLRFHPPKWTMMSLAYKRLVNTSLLKELRLGVVAMNPTGEGGIITTKVGQKMLPQSCSGGARDFNQQKVAIDQLNYASTAHPIAEMLLGTGYYMTGQDSANWVFGTRGIPSSSWDGKGEHCPGVCAGDDFIVLFSDGRGDVANSDCVNDPLSGRPKEFCTTTAQCTTAGMGAEDDGDELLNVTGGLAGINDPASDMTPGRTCSKDYADDVARFLNNNNFNKSLPTQRIKTYVVALGDSRNLDGDLTILQEVARAGGTGAPKYGEDFRSLERAISDIIKSIITNATSFSAAAIPSVQTKGYTSAFIPRFKPSDMAQWGGSLARYQLFNEFSAGCTVKDYGNNDAGLNPNKDKTCDDLYLRQADGGFVGENDKGEFVMLDDSQPWDAGWPVKSASTGGIKAEPVWEAATQLEARMNAIVTAQQQADGGTVASVTVTSGGKSTTYTQRKIFTVVRDSTGALVRKDFTTANAADLAPHLHLGGVNGPFCSQLSGYARRPYANEAECAKDVIRFMHGEDVLLRRDENRVDPAPALLKPRLNILGDIFHSTPVLVTPPIPTFLCSIGLANQCVSTLYLDTTPDAPYTAPAGQTPKSAYERYAEQYAARDQIVLVAANDGMLHAFHAGAPEYTDGRLTGFGLGTGEELWAFIPPDKLPKLQRYVLNDRHEVLLDGSPMVRDVWVDGSGTSQASITKDGKRQVDEFHTMVVVGEREGGRHWFALDVTDVRNPVFKWSWPLPGTTAALDAGQSWNDLGPSPMPIGPIAEASTSGTFTVGSKGARERWIVAVGGGYDPAFVRGRSFNVIDVWTGELVYRFGNREATTTVGDPRKSLMPIAAPVGLLDSDRDAIFDMAVVGDVAGQLWVIDMLAPGTPPAAGGLYTNWSGARAFVQHKGSYKSRSPFFQRVAGSAYKGAGGAYEVRVWVGAGDRDNIKDADGGTCSLANLTACIRKGCTVEVEQTNYRIGPAGQGASTGRYVRTNGKLTLPPGSPENQNSYSTGTHTDACTDTADATIKYNIQCGTSTLVDTAEVYCDWASGAECPVSTGRPLARTLPITTTAATTVANSRFYSVRIFDVAPNQARSRFSDLTGAIKYDGAALTDTDLADLDVATPTPATVAVAKDKGWRVTHSFSLDEKTGSSALLLGGCVLWNTLKPNPDTTTTCGQTTLPPDTAYLYQADALTGAIQCGQPGSETYNAKVRATPRSTYVAPQQQSILVSVNANTGQVLYSGVSIEPGRGPLSISVGESSLMGPIHWLEVPRDLEACRHDGKCE